MTIVLFATSLDGFHFNKREKNNKQDWSFSRIL